MAATTGRHTPPTKSWVVSTELRRQYATPGIASAAVAAANAHVTPTAPCPAAPSTAASVTPVLRTLHLSCSRVFPSAAYNHAVRRPTLSNNAAPHMMRTIGTAPSHR